MQMTDYKCGLCGEEFSSNCAPGKIECPACDAELCPCCGAWFGEEGESQPVAAEPQPAAEPDDLTEHLAVRFPADMIDAVKQLAAAEGMTVSAWIRRGVQVEADRREPKADPEVQRLRSLVAEILADFWPDPLREGASQGLLDLQARVDAYRERAGLERQ